MKKISNDDNFQNYVGKYTDVLVNGTLKKYFVSLLDAGSITTNAGILYKPYSIIGDSTQQFCCSTLSAYCFYICNSNSLKDDDFEIYLNGTSVGSAILGQDAEIGSIFFGGTSSLNVFNFETAIPFICPLNLMVNYYFNPSLISNNSTNTLSMINRVQNNNGNAGSLQLAIFEVCSGKDITSVTNTEIIYTFDYTGDTGDNFVFEFTI